MLLNFVLLWAVAAGLAYSIDGALLRRGWWLVEDRPNARSLHAQPTPRGGGIGILISIGLVGAGVPYIAAGESLPFGIALGAAAVLVAIVSYIDDQTGLPAGVRLAVHLGTAAAWVASSGRLATLELPGVTVSLGSASWIGGACAVIYLCWMTNLYNFMDGIDGLAGGMTVIGFAALAWLGYNAGASVYAGVCVVVAGAASGFCWLNFPPAKIFMGDVGSSSLGFLAGAMLLTAEREGYFPLWVGLVAFAPFVIDASVTLGLRAWRRERVWEAHRSHYYQRLVGIGWSHRQTVLWEYGLMVACAGGAILLARLPVAGQWSGLAVLMLLFVGLLAAVQRLEER